EAESSARASILRYPDAGFAWKVLGAALTMQGSPALPALQKATELLPDDASAHFNLSMALQGLARFDEAAASARRALQIDPDFAEAHRNLGIICHELGKPEEAEAHFRRAQEIRPDDAHAHYNLANALKNLGRLDEAEASYRLALKIDPHYAEAHNMLGGILKNLGRPDDAAASYCRALEIDPDFAWAHSNLGNTLQDLGRFDDAAASYRRAIAVLPDYAEAHNNLGHALQNLRRFDDAMASYCRALEIKPDYAAGHINLGNLLLNIGRLDEAVASYRRALEIKPDSAEAHINLGGALKDLGRLEDAVASYRRALEISPDFAGAHSGLLFAHNYLADQPAATLLAEARRFGDSAARKAAPYKTWRNVPEPEKCLRVGLVSGDLGEHPVGYFLDSNLAALTSHAAGRLELIAYHSHFRTDALTERIKACCCAWHSVAGLSDARLAQLIRDDGIDILIDLVGHTAHNRLPLFAWKPAPVQASWLGYFATTGVAAMDYFIADPWTLPETEEVNFTEKIWRLPETRLCFTPPDADVDISPLPALTNGRLTFGCFNNLSKMNDAVVALWARVLHAVPQSRLFLKAPQLSEASVRQSVLEHFAAYRIGADRLLLEGPSPRRDYLATYSRVDIALDPFPYTGGATTAEALWMAVPVLTLAGERFLPRQGVGLLANAGLPDWIAADADDYVARAAAHAGDLPRLATLRAGLRQQVLASPIFDAPRFARHFEAALRGMWTTWCNQTRQRQ
ncbi:MAG: tetratricopeptide repeat protein, partial [Nevskiales bacterium]